MYTYIIILYVYINTYTPYIYIYMFKHVNLYFLSPIAYWLWITAFYRQSADVGTCRYSPRYTTYTQIVTNDKCWTSFWSPIGCKWKLSTKFSYHSKSRCVLRLFYVLGNWQQHYILHHINGCWPKLSLLRKGCRFFADVFGLWATRCTDLSSTESI